MQNFIVLVVATLAVATVAAGHDNANHPKWPCRGTDMSWEFLKPMMAACASTMSNSKQNEMHKEKNDGFPYSCSFANTTFCHLEYLKIINDGTFHTDALEQTYKQLFPGKVGVELGAKIIASCATHDEIATINKNIPNPDHCLVAKPLMKCIGGVHKERDDTCRTVTAGMKPSYPKWI